MPGAIYQKGNFFADFLFAKVINGENAAHKNYKFSIMATRTRQEYLKDLVMNYCTTQIVEAGPKFQIFSNKKLKERHKPWFNGNATQRGAFCWQVLLSDSDQTPIDCFLGISSETFV